MTDTFRALCVELLDELVARPLILGDLIDRTRNALSSDEPAVPEGREPASVTGEPSDAEGPSIEDVEELCEEHCFNVEGYESIECLQGLINEAIARWGRQPAPPADGEVAELVRDLNREVDAFVAGESSLCWLRGSDLVRITELLQSLASPAALVIPSSPELLEQLKSLPPGRVELLAEAADAAQALEPVPVSEHPWERTGWCDEHGRCWFGAPRDGAVDAGWILRKPSERLSHQTASLPAHALPLPSGEVEK